MQVPNKNNHISAPHKPAEYQYKTPPPAYRVSNTGLKVENYLAYAENNIKS